MRYQRKLFRPSADDTNEIDRLRKLVQDTAALLQRYPAPDTFLGRKTQEPFPKERKNQPNSGT